MRKYPRHAVLGLSIAAASVAVATPASAKYYRMYLAEGNQQNVCLGVNAGTLTKGNKIVTWECLTHPDQNWVKVPYLGTSYVQLSPGSPQPPNPNAMCAALSNNGGIDPNGLVQGWGIIWNCSANTLDQAWEFVPVGPDLNSHDCFLIRNAKAWAMGYDMVLQADYFYSDYGRVAQPVYLEYNNYWANQIWCEYDS